MPTRGWLPSRLPGPLRGGPAVLVDGQDVTIERLGRDGPFLVFRGAGDPAALLDRYPGPLLPESTAPGVAAIRDQQHRRVRARVLHDGDDAVRTGWRSAQHDAGLPKSFRKPHNP